jgi:glycerophosphoryl diester phosphodiesterase
LTMMLIGLLLLLVVYYAGQAALRTSPQMPTQVIAHRGGADLAPENTMAAFRNALEIGVDWLEFDVQVTSDGELIVIHDETVDRTTNGSGEVGDLTLAEIRGLDAGNGEPPPTVQEVIALAKAAGVRIFPEAKNAHLYPGIEEKLLAAIAEAGYLEQTAIQSFSGETLATLRRLNPDAQVCALYGLWEFDVRSPKGDAPMICAMAEMALLYPAIIRQGHQAGRPVFIWFGVVEHPVVYRILRFFGADGFMADDPAALVSVVRGEP